MLVPLLRCVSVDNFETPCFVVEDKHGLNEEMGNDVRKINNGNNFGETKRGRLAKGISF